MKIEAHDENGVMVPKAPLDLPNRVDVTLDVRSISDGPPPTDPMFAHLPPELREVYAILARRYNDGEPGDVLATHNDHQP